MINYIVNLNFLIRKTGLPQKQEAFCVTFESCVKRLGVPLALYWNHKFKDPDLTVFKRLTWAFVLL
jgi:hypothetical protein